MDEQEFRLRADDALAVLSKTLSKAADEYGFEPDFQAGALSIEFEDPPARFVLSPNTPVRQIWVSAHSKSFKLDWNPGRGAFVLPDTGQTLVELVEKAVGEQLGEDVKLG